MLDALLRALLGCRHRRTSLPFTPHPGTRNATASEDHSTYVVCLDCGQRFPYDWEEMKRSRSSIESRQGKS